MAGEIIRIANSKIRPGSFKLQMKLELMFLLWGAPHAEIKKGGIIYNDPGRRTRIIWNDFGFSTVETGERGIKVLVEDLIDSANNHNQRVQECYGLGDWKQIKKLMGPARMIPWVEEIIIIGRDGESRPIFKME